MLTKYKQSDFFFNGSNRFTVISPPPVKPGGTIGLHSVCPSVCLSVSHTRFPHFSPTCIDILSWNFAYDFLLLICISSSIVVNLRQFLWELCPFWNSEYRKYAVLRTFLLHSLTYWAVILYITLFHCTSDQVRVLSINVSFCGSYAPFAT